jgi:hypothetical protein
MASKKKGISFGNVKPAEFSYDEPPSRGIRRTPSFQLKETNEPKYGIPTIPEGDPRVYQTKQQNIRATTWDPTDAWLKGGKKKRKTLKRKSTKKRITRKRF